MRVPLFVASISGMRTYLALPSLILCGVLCYMPTSGLSADEQLPSFTLPESQNQIIKISDVGLLPKTLEMKKEDGIVFFLNDSTDALITIDLDFGKSATHCASENGTSHRSEGFCKRMFSRCRNLPIYHLRIKAGASRS